MRDTKRIEILLAIPLFAMGLTACVDMLHWRGRITPELVALVDQAEPAFTLVIDSKGGNGLAAIQAGHILRQKKAKLVIDGACSSSCAEFLLPGSRAVDVRGDAIVALHGSFIADRALSIERYGPSEGECFKGSAKLQLDYWELAHVRSDAWRETAKRLIPIEQPPPSGGRCGKVEYRHEFWLPTSRQLKDLFGIKISGRLCADSPRCVRTKIKSYWKTGTVVVGDKVVTVGER
jgi:hypothetical protein